METLGRYLVSVSSVCLLCGIVQSFFTSGWMKKLGKLLSGVVVTMAVLAPLPKLHLPEMSQISDWEDKGQQAVAVGEEYRADQLAQSIKAETEAYILDKAGELGMRISAEVSCCDADTPAPKSCIIKGTYTDPQKQAMEQILFLDLGIAKEDQTWIGEEEKNLPYRSQGNTDMP